MPPCRELGISPIGMQRELRIGCFTFAQWFPMQPVVFFLVAVLAMSPHVMHAQDAPPPTDTSAMAEPPSIWEGIDLTDAQKAEMRQIAEAARARLQTAFGVRDPRTPLTEAQRTLQLEVIADQRAAIRQLLTPEQLTRLDENLQARLDSTTTEDSTSTP